MKREKASKTEREGRIDIAIGLDIGHSAPKTVWAALNDPGKHHQDIFPTVVTRAFPLTDEATRERAALGTVTVNDIDYFFGDTALKQGRAKTFSGQERDWILTETHDVLVMGAFKRVQDQIKRLELPPVGHYEIVVGLPSEWYSAQKATLKTRITNLLNSMLTDGQTLNVRPQEQPFGPLQELIFTAEGEINPDQDLDNESWGIIEVGQFTTDFILIEGEDKIESANGSCVGFTAVYERMSAMLQAENLPADFRAVDTAVTKGYVMQGGTQVDVATKLKLACDPLIDLVRDEAKRRFSEHRHYLNGVIVAGGGAPLVFKGIEKDFPLARIPENPRFSVAEGFCRLALYKLLNR